MQAAVLEGIPETLPEHPGIDLSVDHVSNRRQILSAEEKLLALENALRYIPSQHHETLADEFMMNSTPTGVSIMALPTHQPPHEGLPAGCLSRRYGRRRPSC